MTRATTLRLSRMGTAVQESATLRQNARVGELRSRGRTVYNFTVGEPDCGAPQAVLAAEVGHMDLAYDYLGETARMDLDDLQHNTRDGVHLAALAGTWIALVDGFGGMRTGDGKLAFAPRLPGGLTRLVLNLCYRGRRLRVTATPTSATYALLAGQALQLTHYDTTLTLTPDGPATCPIPHAPVRPRPSQPPGREPLRRK